MAKTFLLIFAVIAALLIAWVGGQTAHGNLLENASVSPGDITISQVSNSKVDWVTLHNNLERSADLQGFVFTDGDNIFVFPQGAAIPAGGEMRIASNKDEGEVTVPVEYYWGDWGLSEDGELVSLINNSGDMVVDFVFAQPLEEGQILERVPAGTGPLMDPNKNQPMQMKRPEYRAVSNATFERLGRNFSTSVLEFGSLLAGVVSFIANMDQARDFADKLGLFGKKRKTN